MAEDEVGETIDEAHAAHEEKAEDPGATTGQANEPEVEGNVEPDTGGGEGAASEIPVGVDALTDEQLAKAEAAGPADGGGDGGDEGDGGALDVSALMDDSGDAGDAGEDAGDAGEDAGDAGADATPDDDTDGPDAATEEA
jgi:hypothetical protein